MFTNLCRLKLAIILLFIFNDTVIAQNRNLDHYLELGLANSPLIKDYQNQVTGGLIDSQRLMPSKGSGQG